MAPEDLLGPGVGVAAVPLGYVVRMLVERWRHRAEKEETTREEELAKLQAARDATREERDRQVLASLERLGTDLGAVRGDLSALHQRLDSQAREYSELKERLNHGLEDHKGQLRVLQEFRVATETRAVERVREDRIADMLETLLAKTVRKDSRGRAP